MASNPSFASTPLAPDLIQISTANTNRDGTGTLGTLVTGTADGVVIEQITITATGTTTAGMIRFFLSVDGGTNTRLIYEQQVAAQIPSATVPAFSIEIVPLNGLVLLTTNTILYVSTEEAETFNVLAQKAGL
jgi:hypothetical protein